jgi:ubiquinol-cytochrome c reductase cytochrome b subunit
MLGFGLLVLALAEGVTGYSLPDDLLSGTGLRIIYSAILSIPFLGPSIAFLFFGGEFPTTEMIGRLFVFHVMLLPGLFIAAIGAHIGLTWLQKHTMLPGSGGTERTLTGPPFWPTQVFRSVGLLFLTGAVLVLIAGLVQVNPVWSYGPFVASTATVPAQPDWYVGWLEGALRLGLPIEPTILGVTFATPLVPGIVIPGVLFGLLFLWPFIERRVTGDRRAHHVLQWPWQSPVRTGIGAAILAFFGLLTVAGGNDVLARSLSIRIDTMTLVLQLLLLPLPIAVGWLTYRQCKARQGG